MVQRQAGAAVADHAASGQVRLLEAALNSVIRGKPERVQFTADMLPGDVLGVTILNAQTREFEFKKGPGLH